jgi:hypothetical protein
MYSNQFAVALKVNGRVLREDGDTVYIPFGSEYSILLKNVSSVRAIARIWIDGTDATNGVSLIVPANDSVEIERFIDNFNMEAGKRFKFIERTEKIETGPRGIKIDDGLIRVEFQFEQPVTSPWVGSYITKSVYDSSPNHGVFRSAQYGTGDAINSEIAASCDLEYTVNYSSTQLNSTTSDVGITVGGSVSEQKFTSGAWFPVQATKYTIVLKVLGKVEGKTVKKPVTVKTKQECPTCGTKNKAGTKFCRECGTGLSLV